MSIFSRSRRSREDCAGDGIAWRSPQRIRTKPIVRASNDANQAMALAEIQRVLDQHCLVQVSINRKSRVKVKPLSAKKELIQHGWRNFLVKVINEGGVTSKLRVTSPNALPMVKGSTGSPSPKPQPIRRNRAAVSRCQHVRQSADDEKLSGLKLDYGLFNFTAETLARVKHFCNSMWGKDARPWIPSRDADPVSGCAVNRTDVRVCSTKPASLRPAPSFSAINLDVFYPAQSRRLAPDFFFHAQVYRSNGETIRLPAGTYAVEYTRGPEYRIETRKITIPNQEKTSRTI